MWLISLKSGGPSSPNPLSSPPRWCPWDLFRSFKVYSDAKERVRRGNQREATASIQSLVKLQLWFRNLRWKRCLWQNCNLGSCACSKGPALRQNTLMMIYMVMNNTALWLPAVISYQILNLRCLYQNVVKCIFLIENWRKKRRIRQHRKCAAQISVL